MEPNLPHIRELLRERKWKGSELSRQMGISRSEANRFLNGKRKGGNKVISGLLRAFPEESVESLFILPSVSPNVNTESDIISEGKLAEVRHPQGSGIDCCIDKETGLVEIVHGKCVTSLHVPPGDIKVEYSMKQ